MCLARNRATEVQFRLPCHLRNVLPWCHPSYPEVLLPLALRPCRVLACQVVAQLFWGFSCATRYWAKFALPVAFPVIIPVHSKCMLRV